jgi:hypothetical protein
VQCPPQLDQRLAARDWRWHCERSYTLLLADGQVELFFIDTSPFVQEYQTAVWSVNEGKLHQAHLQGYPMLCPLRYSGWTAAFNSASKSIRIHFSYCVGGILEQSWEANMKELEVRLARSKAKWKIVIGHHPIKSQLQVGDIMDCMGQNSRQRRLELLCMYLRILRAEALLGKFPSIPGRQSIAWHGVCCTDCTGCLAT